MTGRYYSPMPCLRPAALAALVLPMLAQAQVGFPPSQSPYYDLEYRQGFAAIAGIFNASDDPAGVAPRAGPLLGLRYDVRIGGPAYFTTRLARVWSERTPVDPTQPAATRRLAAESVGLYLVDAGIVVNLTGQKSWHRLVPSLHGGVGLASDGQSDADVGGFRFGTTFAFSYGVGVRWVPGGRFEGRVDLGDWLYQIKYPTAYYRPASDGTAVLGDNDPDALWRHNLVLTVGASWAFFR